MKKNLMIVEDDPHILNLLSDYFENFNLIKVVNGPQALVEFERNHIDLVILDVMLPILDGWEVCKQLRKKSAIPIIMLTAKADEESNLKGFRLGVDNYVSKPFSPKILLAKVNVLLKRSENTGFTSNEEYTIDNGFSIDVNAHEVRINSKTCNLSPTEFGILLFLIRNSGIPLSRNTILDSVWGDNYFGDPRIVDTNIKRIREKLGDKGDYIQTIRSIGYKFENRCF